MARRIRQQAFTLIEILVVLSLLGVLMGLSIGFVQRAGRGNLLIQTSNAFAAQLASARAQSFGNNRAYVLVQVDKTLGRTFLRAYRDRQVFHWPCEDFERASELGVMRHDGAVSISTSGDGRRPSREGKHAIFAGGRVVIEDKPWLNWQDGFSIRCRVNPDPGSGSNATLFQKGNALRINLSRDPNGRFDVVARIKLAPDTEGKGAGWYEVRTGRRTEGEVPEWRGPVLPGRWSDLHVSYDRNVFSISVNERLRGAETVKTNPMKPDDLADKTEFIVGGGYSGGFDSLLIGGIYEDDDDRFELPESVLWVDADGKPQDQTQAIHFRNRSLDPRHHAEALEFTFRLDEGEEQGARRRVLVTLSGESFVRRAGE